MKASYNWFLLLILPILFFQNCSEGLSRAEWDNLSSASNSSAQPSAGGEDNSDSAGLPSGTTSVNATPTPAPTPTPPVSSYKVPFSPASSWNTPIPANATYTKLNWPASTGYNYGVNWDGYSPAVYNPTGSDPMVAVAIPANWGYPAGNIMVRLKAGISGAKGTDGEIVVIEGTTVHNFWQFNRKSDTTATASAYGRADINTGTGWGSKSPFLSAGITACGASEYAGLLVQAETDAGEIKHALQLVGDYALMKPGFTGEAIAGDGGNPTGIIQEGQRLAVPRNLAMPNGLSALGQKVFRAYQSYGVFVNDVAGGTSVLRAQQNAYNAATINALSRDLLIITPMLQRVGN